MGHLDADRGLCSCRMKFLWTPYVCMFTAFGICSPELWMTLFKWLKLKSIHPVVLVSGFSDISPVEWNIFLFSVCKVIKQFKHEPDTFFC